MTAPASRAERAYRALLRLYPAPFRSRFGDDMVQLFGDQLRDAAGSRGFAGMIALWLRTLGDLLVTATGERARRDRTVAHSLSVAPPASSRVLGLLGILGGLVLVAAFVRDLPWTRELFQLRLVLFNVGAIAIVLAVLRRDRSGSRAVRVTGSAVIIANAAYLAMVIVGIDRPQPPEPDPVFRLVWFYVGAAMWLADAAFGLVAWRARVVNRWGALALAIGSVLAFTGMDRLELVRGEWAWFFGPAALFGIALHGVGWILLGLDVALRRRQVPAEVAETPVRRAP